MIPASVLAALRLGHEDDFARGGPARAPFAPVPTPSIPLPGLASPHALLGARHRLHFADGGALPDSIAAALAPPLSPTDTSGNALHRWDEVGPQPGAADAFAAAHPAFVGAARTVGDVGTSMTSGHALDDYARWVDPSGGYQPGLMSAPGLVARAADAIHGAATDPAGLAAGLARGVGASVYSGVTLPGDVMQGKVDPTDASVLPRVLDTVGLLGGAGLPMAEEGAAGIFGGRLSATADHAAADRAEQMLARGEFPSDVLKETGWFRGTDGAMRYEIPDDQAFIKGGLQTGAASQARTVGGALWHPDLFAAYPDLANTPFSTAGVPDGARGAYVAADPYRDLSEAVRLRSDLSSGQANSTMLHELQHAIQAREGFAQGSSPALMQTAIDKGLAARNALSFRQEIDALPGSGSLYDKSLAVVDQYNQMGMGDVLPNAAERSLAITAHQPLLQQRADFLEGLAAPRAQSFYERAAGETEARNVQYRRTLTPEQRVADEPWTTQDVPTDRQITRYEGGRTATDTPDTTAAPLAAAQHAGQNATADPFAAIMAGLDAHAAENPYVPRAERPMAETGIVDPAASSWRLYHGTDHPDWTTFDPAKAGARTHGSEVGAFYMSPRDGEAEGYATGEHARVLPLDVTPGDTGVYDVARMTATRDPRFMAALEEESRGAGLSPAIFQDALSRYDRDVAYHNDLLGRMPPDVRATMPDHPTMSNLMSPQAAAVRMAREDGRDTAILRGLGESAGGDQIVALRPGFVRHADTGALVYSGGLPTFAPPGGDAPRDGFADGGSIPHSILAALALRPHFEDGGDAGGGSDHGGDSSSSSGESSGSSSSESSGSGGGVGGFGGGSDGSDSYGGSSSHDTGSSSSSSSSSSGSSGRDSGSESSGGGFSPGAASGADSANEGGHSDASSSGGYAASSSYGSATSGPVNSISGSVGAPAAGGFSSPSSSDAGGFGSFGASPTATSNTAGLSGGNGSAASLSAQSAAQNTAGTSFGGDADRGTGSDASDGPSTGQAFSSFGPSPSSPYGSLATARDAFGQGDGTQGTVPSSVAASNLDAVSNLPGNGYAMGVLGPNGADAAQTAYGTSGVMNGVGAYGLSTANPGGNMPGFDNFDAAGHVQQSPLGASGFLGVDSREMSPSASYTTPAGVLPGSIISALQGGIPGATSAYEDHPGLPDYDKPFSPNLAGFDVGADGKPTWTEGASFGLPAAAAVVATPPALTVAVPTAPAIVERPASVDPSAVASSYDVSGFDLSNPKQAFLAKIQPYAQRVSQATGIDARIVAAQAALESAYGASAPSNNFFGIKGLGTGPISTMESINGVMTPTKASFAGYDSMQGSFDGYTKLMSGNRYAGVRNGSDVDSQVSALGQSGYATDPKYSSKIGAIVSGMTASDAPTTMGSTPSAPAPTQVASVGEALGQTPADMQNRYALANPGFAIDGASPNVPQQYNKYGSYRAHDYTQADGMPTSMFAGATSTGLNPPSVSAFGGMAAATGAPSEDGAFSTDPQGFQPVTGSGFTDFNGASLDAQLAPTPTAPDTSAPAHPSVPTGLTNTAANVALGTLGGPIGMGVAAANGISGLLGGPTIADGINGILATNGASTPGAGPQGTGTPGDTTHSSAGPSPTVPSWLYAPDSGLGLPSPDAPVPSAGTSPLDPHADAMAAYNAAVSGMSPPAPPRPLTIHGPRHGTPAASASAPYNPMQDPAVLRALGLAA